MLVIIGIILFRVLQVKESMGQDLQIKSTWTTFQPLIPGDTAVLHVTSRNTFPEDIADLEMKLSLPYFLSYQSLAIKNGSIAPTQVLNQTELAIEFTGLAASENVSLGVKFLVIRLDLVPTGRESTSTVYIDARYKTGSESCSDTLTSHAAVTVLLYNPSCEPFSSLGITDGRIKESQLRVSSLYKTTADTIGRGPYRAGLGTREYWAPAQGLPSFDHRQYLEVDFISPKNVKMISVQGHPDSGAKIKSFQIKTSDDGIIWKDYGTGYLKMYMTGIGEPNSEVLTGILEMPLTTRWLRINPRFRAGRLQPGLRLELYGCPTEERAVSYNREDPALGMESNQIADRQITASSRLPEYDIAGARLNSLSGWCPDPATAFPYLQVDSKSPHVISALSTQCEFKTTGTLSCRKSFQLRFISSGTWYDYSENGKVKLFAGNFQETTVKHHLIKPITGETIRFSTREKIGLACMRIELYGRKVEEYRSDLPVIFSRSILVDPHDNRLFVCSAEKSKTRSHCYVTDDGKVWTELNFQLLSMLGLDKKGFVHGVALNRKAFVQCDQNGQGSCIGVLPEIWYRVRDDNTTITAVEVPHIAETGLGDLPHVSLSLMDGLGRIWGASARGIHLKSNAGSSDWRLVLTWQAYDFYKCSLCTNGGTCILGDTDFICLCEPGWTGHDCEISIDDCVQSICENGATCVDEHLGYRCDCAPGFKELYCDQETDECTPDLCDHGSCTDKHLDYTCSCDSGYTGRNCETGIDDCVSVVCQNGATCVDKHLDYSCTCAAGFEGDHCEEETNECAPDPCQHGNCTDEFLNYTCSCDIGFTGRNCEVGIDDCVNSECSNGATCVDEHLGYSCDCAPGFEGDYCGVATDECAPSPCQHGICTDKHLDYTCSCYSGYTGRNCDVVDPCALSPCKSGERCVNVVLAVYRCEPVNNLLNLL